MAGPDGGTTRLRRWVDSDTAKDDLYDVPGEQFAVMTDLIRRGNKQEALMFLSQYG